MVAQLNIDSKHRPVNINAIVAKAPIRLTVAFGEISVRYMHPIQAGENCIARTEVISHSTAHVESKCEVLSLRVLHAERPFGIDIAEADAPIEIRSNPPVTRNEVAPHAHDVSEITGLGSARNRNHRPAVVRSPLPPRIK